MGGIRHRLSIDARARQTGFTLLEVLVALAVLAVAMAALIQAAAGYTANQAYLRDRTLAHWVARDALQSRQLDAAKSWPAVGEQHDSRTLGGRQWDVTVKVSDTSDKDLRRLDVKVYPAGDDDGTPLATLTGFVGRGL